MRERIGNSNEKEVRLPIAEARNILTQLPEQLEASHDTITVTRRGKPVLAVLSYDFYDSLIETLEIMGDPELMKSLHQSITEANSGRTVKWQSAKKKLEIGT